jgi:hypothetical protein
MKMKTSYETGRLIHGIPINEYHAIKGVYSSSQLKDILKDEEYFFKKYIKGTIAKEESSAFDVGTFFHTLVLEPHMIDIDCAVFKGKVRNGSDWERFKEKHKGKAIVNEREKKQAELLAELVFNSPVAMSFVKRGTPEQSAFVDLDVYGTEIFQRGKDLVLSREGWTKAKRPKVKGPVSLKVKVRSDSMGDDFVLDLKSTSINAKSEREVRGKISHYAYDLSAALYVDMFETVDGKKRDFVWTFASKEHHNAKTYMASRSNIEVGRAKYMKALVKIAQGIKTDWKFGDSLTVLEPNVWELEILKESDLDLV